MFLREIVSVNLVGIRIVLGGGKCGQSACDACDSSEATMAKEPIADSLANSDQSGIMPL